MHHQSRFCSRFVLGRSLAAWLLLGMVVTLLPPGTAGAFVPTPNTSCEDGNYMRWYGGPTTWYLNQRGYSGLEFDLLQSIIQQGVDSWSAPCCSGFRSSYLGTTSLGIGVPPEKNVILFGDKEEDWPRELGLSDSVIASTFRQGTTLCSISSAFMIFNAIHFNFFPPDAELGDRDVDLLSIAVHEFGHWLGLGHTDVPDAIMRMTYNYGTRFTDLHQDDIDGVCAIYPGSCEVCGSDDECPAESVCVEGVCTLPDCRTTQDCAEGTICSDSSCIPGCRAHVECDDEEACVDGTCVERGTRCENHVDCAPGQSCTGGRCGAQPSSCAICDACSFDSDCGLDAYCMAISTFGDAGRCIKPCETDRECAGNSVCRAPAGNTSKFCLDPSNNPTSLCSGDYRCEVPEPGPSLGCALLGEPCTGGSQGCGGRSDTCYDALDGPACSCSCSSDDECGPGARCLPDPSSNDLPSCFPGSLLIACGETACFPGQRCVDEGSCEADPCYEVSCADDEVCLEGSCSEVEKPAPVPKSGRKTKSGCASTGAGDGAPLLALLIATASIRLMRNRSRNMG